MTRLTLSKAAIDSLRAILIKKHGECFGNAVSDTEVSEIGELLLTILSEGMKLKFARPELFKGNCE